MGGYYNYTFSVNEEWKLIIDIYSSEYCSRCNYLWSGYLFAGDWVMVENVNTNIDYPIGFSNALFLTSDPISAYMYCSIIPPATATYTFMLIVDDWCTIYIDDVLVFDTFPWGTFYFTYDLTGSQKYTLKLKYCNIGGPAQLQLYWTYGGGSYSIVPIVQNGYEISNLLGSSPYSVDVSGPLWGNAKRHSPEQWDDANTINGDGCSEECVVEHNWVWVGGTPTSRDYWSQWPIYHVPNGDKSACVKQKESKTTKAYFYILFTAVSMNVLANFIDMLASTNSVTGIFAGLNSIQMIDLLPLAAKYMAYDVVLFITYSPISFLDLSFVNMNSNFFPSLDAYFGYEQTHWYFLLLNLDSGSSFINTEYSLFLLSIAVWCSLIAPFLILCGKSSQKVTPKEAKVSKTQTWCRNSILKFHRTYLFNFYVRFFMTYWLVFWLVTLYELKNNEMSFDLHYFSWVSAVVIVATVILMTLFAMFYVCWFLSAKTKISQVYYFRHFVDDLRETKLARSYIAVFMIRRLFSCMILAFINESQFIVRLTIFTIIQVIYLFYMLLSIPHELADHNINEVIAELTYILLCCLLYCLNSKPDWNQLVTQVYILTILFWNIIWAIISASAAIYRCRQKEKYK